MKKFVLPAVVLSSLVLLGCQSTGSGSTTVSKTNAGVTITGLGDKLEPDVLLHTLEYQKTGRVPLTGDIISGQHDVWLRTYINKTTKNPVSHIYLSIRNRSDARWDRLVMLGNNGLVTLNGNQVDLNITTTYGTNYWRDIVFPISEELLQFLANSSESEIEMRLSSSTSSERETVKITTQEFKNLLAERQRVLEQI